MEKHAFLVLTVVLAPNLQDGRPRLCTLRTRARGRRDRSILHQRHNGKPEGGAHTSPRCGPELHEYESHVSPCRFGWVQCDVLVGYLSERVSCFFLPSCAACLGTSFWARSLVDVITCRKIHFAICHAVGMLLILRLLIRNINYYY